MIDCCIVYYLICPPLGISEYIPYFFLISSVEQFEILTCPVHALSKSRKDISYATMASL